MEKSRVCADINWPLTFAHHVGHVQNVFVDNATECALMDVEGSWPIMSWTCCTNCGVRTVSERGLCFLRLATLSTLPSDASNSRRTLRTNDRVTLKNCDISRSLYLACIAIIRACLFISWVSFLSSVYDLRRNKGNIICREVASSYVSECEKVLGFTSASLFPARKRESVIQGGTIEPGG